MKKALSAIDQLLLATTGSQLYYLLGMSSGPYFHEEIGHKIQAYLVVVNGRSKILIPY